LRRVSIPETLPTEKPEEPKNVLMAEKKTIEEKLSDLSEKVIIGSNSCETGLLKPTKPKISLNKKIPHG